MPRQRIIVVAALLCSLVACGGSGAPGQAVPSAGAPGIPDIEAYAWRDFMPAVPSSHLRVVVAYDHGAPVGPNTILRIDAVRQGDQTWVPVSSEIRDDAAHGVLRCLASGGPEWATGSGIEVDVTYGPGGLQSVTVPGVIDSTH